MGSAERVVTIAVAHRWARPTWVISCRIVQSGQVGTGRVRSAPSTRRASVAVLPAISPYHRSAVIAGIGAPAGSGWSAAAARAAAAAATRRGGGPAANGDRGEKLYGVVMPLGAGAGVGRLRHRAADLERGAARPAAVLITWHACSLCHRAAASQRPPSAGVVCREDPLSDCGPRGAAAARAGGPSGAS